MSLVMLLVWLAVIAVVAVVVWFGRTVRHQGVTPLVGQESSTRAQQVQAVRFAHGDIDEQQYVGRRDLLRTC